METKRFHCENCGQPLSFHLRRDYPSFGPDSIRLFMRRIYDLDSLLLDISDFSVKGSPFGYDGFNGYQALIVRCNCGSPLLSDADLNYLAKHICENVEIEILNCKAG